MTVLFADLVGFTELSRKLRAGDVVDLLNDLFSRFDSLVGRHGAEKIKTIGDAYMAAAGLSGSRGDHVASIADLALDMREAFVEFCQHHGLALKLRIGVHSGEVVAGVIGRQKFAYDLWGDTVNVASRMESTACQVDSDLSGDQAVAFGPLPRGAARRNRNQRTLAADDVSPARGGMTAPDTFETCPPILRMSVHRRILLQRQQNYPDDAADVCRGLIRTTELVWERIR